MRALSFGFERRDSVDGGVECREPQIAERKRKPTLWGLVVSDMGVVC